LGWRQGASGGCVGTGQRVWSADGACGTASGPASVCLQSSNAHTSRRQHAAHLGLHTSAHTEGGAWITVLLAFPPLVVYALPWRGGLGSERHYVTLAVKPREDQVCRVGASMRLRACEGRAHTITHTDTNITNIHKTSHTKLVAYSLVCVCQSCMSLCSQSAWRVFVKSTLLLLLRWHCMF
jgi:hypothetical protein